MPSRSIIRTYTLHSAVVCYDNGSNFVVAIIDDMLGMKYTELAAGYTVLDMDIANNFAFVCGHKGASAFFACIDLTQLTNGVGNILYQETSSATVLKRLSAYVAPSGTTKLVAIGESEYVHGEYPTICEMSTTSPLYKGFPALTPTTTAWSNS